MIDYFKSHKFLCIAALLSFILAVLTVIVMTVQIGWHWAALIIVLLFELPVLSHAFIAPSYHNQIKRFLFILSHYMVVWGGIAFFALMSMGVFSIDSIPSFAVFYFIITLILYALGAFWPDK